MNSRGKLNKAIQRQEQEWYMLQKKSLYCESELSKKLFSGALSIIFVLGSAFTFGWFLGRQERSKKFARRSGQWLKTATMVKLKKTVLNFLYILF